MIRCVRANGQVDRQTRMRRENRTVTGRFKDQASDKLREPWFQAAWEEMPSYFEPKAIGKTCRMVLDNGCLVPIDLQILPNSA